MRLQGRILNPTNDEGAVSLEHDAFDLARAHRGSGAIVPRIENLSTNESMAGANFSQVPRRAPRGASISSFPLPLMPVQWCAKSLRRRTRILGSAGTSSGRPERPPTRADLTTSSPASAGLSPRDFPRVYHAANPGDTN